MKLCLLCQAFDCRQYSWPAIATAGLLVLYYNSVVCVSAIRFSMRHMCRCLIVIGIQSSVYNRCGGGAGFRSVWHCLWRSVVCAGRINFPLYVGVSLILLVLTFLHVDGCYGGL